MVRVPSVLSVVMHVSSLSHDPELKLTVLCSLDRVPPEDPDMEFRRRPTGGFEPGYVDQPPSSDSC